MSPRTRKLAFSCLALLSFQGPFLGAGDLSSPLRELEPSFAGLNLSSTLAAMDATSAPVADMTPPSTITAAPVYSAPLSLSTPKRNPNVPQFKRISSSLEIYECENFLTESECDELIKEARPDLERSTVVDDYGNADDTYGAINSVRTSNGMFFQKETENPIIQNLRQRVFLFTGIPTENGEALQMLQYGVGGEYKPHFDCFDPTTPGGAFHYESGGQRVATVLFYLSNVEEGGQTIFPEAGIAVTPKKGKAVVFYSICPDGCVNPKSLHGGAPVIAGEKWLATLWLREGKTP